jgi:hypothetical protein
MARTVRVLGQVRRSPATDEPGSDPRLGAEGREQARMYALPAERGKREGAPQPWDQLAGEHPQLVVLADPGMGKSWLIRAETHRLALAATGTLANASTGVENALIPVPIRADVLAAAPGRDLAEAVGGYLAEEGQLAARSAARMRQRIAAGGVVLLVDALDEVPRAAATAGGQAPVKRLQDLLRQWAGGCPGTARCVLTSRLAGYTGPPVLGAREAELLPFTPQDTRAALPTWHLTAQAARRVDHLLGNPAVAGMARVPLLVALICSLAADPDWAEVIPVLGGLLATHDPAGAKTLLRYFLSQWPDPLHRAFHTAIRILGDHPAPASSSTFPRPVTSPSAPLACSNNTSPVTRCSPC